MPKSVQMNLGPMGVTPVDRTRASRSTSVDQATALLRKAVADCGYTLDALEAAMGKGRAYIGKVLNGEKPVSLEFITALPDDVEARFEQLRGEDLGLIVATPAEDTHDAAQKLLTGVFYFLGKKGAA